ncbi:SusC/RagA family TonB-linked outer membrane protein [Algoriphagus winogradskyi]|uniref:TonB-linked outer membrane protein, SusC/RagA family n=1 Tax=Algoriphagus winogradskyi TaxID=237017 RepID=A0ABY1NIJ6_9BACT|nr:TonB-dependent receptor [Algoriphagus winogradskyi]SMP08530.1 TonB-linked outer membrane protein, SusC/RagA family [Algoriphagus winogradskyi]
MKNSTTKNLSSIRMWPETKVNFGILGCICLLLFFLSSSGSSMAQTSPIAVKGTVVDSEGLPLPGLTILVKGATAGTVTDSEGRYSITVPGESTVLAFSYIGYQSQEITVGSRTIIDLVMEEDISSLNEVVVVGYGTQKVTNLTGAVDVVEGKVLADRPSPSVSQLLQGTSPGLTFSVGNNGFQPGAEMNIQIRGMGSLNGGSPYVVIDGIPGDMDRLNPNDIESISVLKDAAASAIFGARAPYGVIVITTKSGRGKLKASYSGSVGVASPQNLPSMLNSYDHAKVINEAGVFGAGGRFFPNRTIDNILAFQNGDFDFLRSNANFPADATFFETTPNPNNVNQWGFNQFGNANRDWFDEYFGKGMIQKHDLSLSGGSEKTSYYFSAGLYGQSGVLNYGTDTFDRYNIMGKITTSITDKWDFTYQPRFSKQIREIPNMDRQGSYDLIFHQIARTMPTNAMYDGFGNIMIQSKIPWVNDAGTDITETTENWHTFATDLRPTEGWTIHGDFAMKNTDIFYRSNELTVYDHLVDGTVTPSGNTVPSNTRRTHYSNLYWTSNIYTSYEFQLNEVHNFKAMVGTQFEKTQNRNLSGYRTNLLVPNVPSLNTADGEIQMNENLLTVSTQGYFGRFNYNFDEKYLIEVNARYDGSSRFREGNRWGFFPSFSAGWNIDKESFWQPISQTVNTFKIRGSWGELGNQNVDPYQDLQLIPLSGNAVNWIFSQGGTRPIGFAGTPSLISPDLTWETARSIDIGADMSFLDNRLKFVFDWFERTTFDMIGPVDPAPGVLGATVPQSNNATLRTRGWETTINYGQTLSNGLTFNVGFNIFDSRTFVTEYLNPNGVLSTWYEGREQGEIWGYTANELYASQEDVDSYTSQVDLSDLTGLSWNPGDVKYLDINGDGKVDNGTNTLENPGDLSIIGNSTPRWQYGLNLNASFKGFDLSMIWRGVGKRDIAFGSGDNIFWGFRSGNQSSLFPEHLDYFRDTPGDMYTGLYEGDANINLDAYFPRPYINDGQNNKNRLTSTRYLQSGAYLRLQNLQVGYTLPDPVLNKMRLSNFRMYVTGENLLTFSKIPVGIDPVATGSSWGAGKTYGADRMISVGVQVSY